MKMRAFPLLAGALVTLHLARPAPAATIYSNLQDIAIPTNFAGVYLDIDTGATSTSSFTGWDINPFFGGSAIGNNAAFQPVRISTSNLDRVLNLAAGTVISGSLTYSSGFGGSGNTGHEHIGAGGDQFQVGAEGYLGFKFTKNGGSGPFYGWMRVTLTNNAAGAVIRDWGYDDAGGAIAIGRVQQSAALTNAQTVTLSPGTGESFTLGSAITDTGGNTNSLLKTGAGSTTLASANTFTGTTIVSNGTLALGSLGALTATTSVAVNSGGTLLLGTSDQINNGAGITLNGGTFNTAGLSETVGVLTLSVSSIIDMGTGNSILHFADSHLASWTGTLSIWNWSGNQNVGGGTDQLFFGGPGGGGLTVGQLSQVKFYSDAGMTILPYAPGFSAFTAGFGEIAPVPEPSSVAVAMSLLGLIGWRERWKQRQVRRAERRAVHLPAPSV